MSKPVQIAVLLSGGGTTLQNLLDRIVGGTLDARVVAVLSSQPDAFGLERARQAGIPAIAASRKSHADTTTFNDALHDSLRPFEIDLVVMAGFLSIFQPRERFTGRVMNIHPALIPAFSGPGFYGQRVHRAVIESGVRISGCTVHFADDEYDHGPIILQGTVPVLEDDTPEALGKRVHALENDLYPEAIQLWADGRLVIEGRRVRIRPR